MAKKMNLAKEAQDVADDIDIEDEVTEELLLELCPAEFISAFKKAKSSGQRADFLYAADKYRLEAQRELEGMKKFLTKLEKWFIQNLPDDDATGIAGKTARVQIKHKDRPSVTDWDKFYEYIRKNRAFELLNRAVNRKSVQERWDNGKQVPGVEKFAYKAISLTKLK